MTGPKKIGFWSDLKAVNTGNHRGFLNVGNQYRVIKDFVDYDGTTHKKGERWTFLAYSYNCYDNGLQWFITFDNVQEWQIPLLLDDKEQEKIDIHPEVYIEVYN